MYGRRCVAVDGDYLLRPVHPDAVLYGAGDPECYVDVGRHYPSGQPHLAGARHPSLLHERTGAADLRAHLGSDGFRHSDEGAVLQTVAECYEDACLGYVVVGLLGDITRDILDLVARVLPVDGGPLTVLLLGQREGSRADGRHLRESDACDIGNEGPPEGGTGGDELPPIHPEVGAVCGQARMEGCCEAGRDFTALGRRREQDHRRLRARRDLADAVGIGLRHVRRFDPLVAHVVKGIYPVSEQFGVQGFHLWPSEGHSHDASVGHLRRLGDEFRACIRYGWNAVPLLRLDAYQSAVGGRLVDVVVPEHPGRQPVRIAAWTSRAGSAFASAHSFPLVSLIMNSAASFGSVISTFTFLRPSFIVFDDSILVREPFMPTE